MGGEIGIVDKERGEKGTCFRFNIFLTVCKPVKNGYSDDIEAYGDGSWDDYSQYHSSPEMSSSPKLEGSHVVLFISSEGRSKILQKFIRRLGIKVSIVKDYQQLPHTLKKIKEKLFHSHSSGSRKDNESVNLQKEVPLSAFDGSDDIQILHKKNATNFVLMVIDANAGPFREISKAVAEFRRDLSQNFSRVVWLARSMNIQQGLDGDKLSSMDLIISNPFHGSRLYQVISLLPEFGGKLVEPPETKEEITPTLPQEKKIEEIDNRPLKGKKVLIAEDDTVLRKIASAMVSRLGADIYQCQNGEDALRLIVQNLNDQREHRSIYSLPFDYILMDCEVKFSYLFHLYKMLQELYKYFEIFISFSLAQG